MAVNLWTLERNADGAIIKRGAQKKSTASRAEAGFTLHTGEYGDPETQYYTGGTLTARPAATATIDKASITANGTDAATISNLVAGDNILVLHDGVSQGAVTAASTSESFTCDRVGVLTFTVFAFPKLPVTFEVAAV